jgi:hypothetical protein
VKKKARKRRPLWHPVYRFGKDVKGILKRAKKTLLNAERRLADDLKKKGKR